MKFLLLTMLFTTLLLSNYSELKKDEKYYDSKLALELMNKYSRTGDPEAMYDLAINYSRDKSGKYKKEEVLNLMKKSSKKGYEPASIVLGKFYITK